MCLFSLFMAARGKSRPAYRRNPRARTDAQRHARRGHRPVPRPYSPQRRVGALELGAQPLARVESASQSAHAETRFTVACGRSVAARRESDFLPPSRNGRTPLRHPHRERLTERCEEVARRRAWASSRAADDARGNCPLQRDHHRARRNRPAALITPRLPRRVD